MWYGILWYGATSVCDAAAGWASEFLVIKWRLSLTRICHEAYVRGPTLYKLAQGKGHDRAGKEVFVDNSDQRVCTVSTSSLFRKARPILPYSALS